MKYWIAGLAAVMMTVAVQAAEFSGKITAIESDADGNHLVVDGRSYSLTPDTAIFVQRPDGGKLYISKSQLQAGLWVRYGLSNQAGMVGELESVQVSGPAEDVKRLIQSAP